MLVSYLVGLCSIIHQSAILGLVCVISVANITVNKRVLSMSLNKEFLLLLCYRVLLQEQVLP